MPVSESETLQKIVAELEEIRLIAYRFDCLLQGFKKYDEHKGTLDINHYEALLDMYAKAIIAMEENNNRFNRLAARLEGFLSKE